MTKARELSLFFGVLLAGTAVALVLRLDDLVARPGYLLAVTVLLAVGLLGSTSQVGIDDLRRNGVRVLLAVSVGVVAKAAFIGGGLFLIFREPRCLILGVVVAQIDPLATAAGQSLTRLSPRARSLLSAWASFDDPVTTLLAIYLSAFVLAAGAAGATVAVSPGSFALTFLANLLFAGAVWLLWRGFLRRSAEPPGAAGRRRAIDILAVLLLIAVVVVAVSTFWMLGLALAGLFLRPFLAMRVLPRATRVAFLVAAFALGLTLVEGVTIVQGLVLGVLAYLAQVVVGLMITTGLPGSERRHIALGQQNGITAVILALALEPSFPGTIGIVAPAILCINLLHAAANAPWASIRLRPVPAATPAPIIARRARGTLLGGSAPTGRRDEA